MLCLCIQILFSVIKSYILKNDFCVCSFITNTLILLLVIVVVSHVVCACLCICDFVYVHTVVFSNSFSKLTVFQCCLCMRFHCEVRSVAVDVLTLIMKMTYEDS